METRRITYTLDGYIINRRMGLADQKNIIHTAMLIQIVNKF